MPKKPSKKPKAKVYIDGANMFYTQRDLGWIFDWKKVKRVIKKNFNVKEFVYYTPLKKGQKKQEEQMKRLRRWGFRVVTKPPKEIRGELKANFDVEMSIDIILDIIDGWKDEIVLLSGDSDFAYLVKILQKRFKRRVFIFSSKKFLSWELKFLASQCFFFEDLREKIFLKNWEKRLPLDKKIRK